MIKTIAGELPTKTYSNSHLARLDHFNHFINLKCIDFFYGKAHENLKDTEKKVIDNTVNKYWYLTKDYSNFLQKEDLKIAALETVWDATAKYLFGIEKWNVSNATKKNPIFVKYDDNFNFCKFANEQIKYKLRLIIYKDKTTNSVSRLPDSDPVRKIFFNFNNWKYENNLHLKSSLSDEDLLFLSKKYDCKFKHVKLVEQFETQIPLNADQYISDDGEETYWDHIEDTRIDTEKDLNNEIILKEFESLLNNFYKNLSYRDKFIFIELKVNQNCTLKELSKKFNISIEGVRKIAEKISSNLKIYIIKNKNNLIDKRTGKLNLSE